ncbi:MAG: zinc ribbon domain-containing protein [Bdellovibrionota bacterium]
MPIYEYECVDKGHRFEVIQKMSDDPIAVLQECGGKVRKMISAADSH